MSGVVARDELWARLSVPGRVAPAISPACAAVLADTLRLAWVALWARGGARPGASITDAGVARGRVWERHAPAPLPFTSATLALLRWMVATPLAAPRSTLAPLPARPLALGDEVAVYLALAAADGTPALPALAAQPLVRAAPLAWLGFAHELAPVGPGVPPPAAFGGLAAGAGAIVVEALAPELARRWTAAELRKRAAAAPAELVAIGAAQDAALAGFMAA